MAKNEKPSNHISHIRESTGRKIFSACNYAFFLLLILICFFPLYYILVQSLSGSIVAGKGILCDKANVFVPEKYHIKGNVQQALMI